MITLYRRFRKKLINSGSIIKYLLYAFGEILLVVVGILIALQVSNWNTERNNEMVAREYKELLLVDLKADTTMLQTLIDESMEKHENARRLMTYYHDGVNTFEDTLSIFYAIQSVGRTNSPSFRNNTYSDLVNTGNIKLIKDRTTVDALMTYYTNDFSDWSGEYIHRLWREYLPVAIDLLPLDFLEDHVKLDSGEEIEFVLENYVPDDNPDLAGEILNSFRQKEEMAFLLKNVSRTHLVQIFFLQTAKGLASEALEHVQSDLQ